MAGFSAVNVNVGVGDYELLLPRETKQQEMIE